MMADVKSEIAPYNKIQGIASENVPAYSNEHDDFISFEGFYIHGIYTGYKWQCVEYARRWLLLRKSCIFQNVGSAADMWQELTYVERITDGKKFSVKTYSNGSPHKPKCDTFLIYPRAEEIPFGHIAAIVEVQEDFIRVAEQNYQFHYWTGNYARQIPMVYRNGLYYIEDYYNVYGWMEIENNDQLKPLNQLNIKSILSKYQQSKPIGKLERCLISNKTLNQYYSLFNINDRKEKLLMQSNNQDISYYKGDEDFLLNVSSTSNELYRLFMQVTDTVIHNDELLIGFGIPKQFWSKIRQSWTNERGLDLIDHLDFKFDGKKLKLCQYKIDNALTMLKSTILQEKWAQTMKLNYDFTSSFQLHRLLIRNWKRLNIKTTIHILIDNDQNEMMTALYMKEIMTEASISSKLCILSKDIYWKDSTIVDKDGEIIKVVWKLWNWEMSFQDCVAQEENGCNKYPCLSDILLNEQIRIIEPLWKSITTHTIFLSVVYAMFPSHPNIIQDEWIVSEDSKQIPFINGSIDEQSKENIVSYNTKNNFNRDDNINEYFDYRYTPQELFSGKSYKNSDAIIVSWMINSLYSGFSIHADQNQIMDINSSITYCCII